METLAKPVQLKNVTLYLSVVMGDREKEFIHCFISTFILKFLSKMLPIFYIYQECIFSETILDCSVSIKVLVLGSYTDFFL